MATKIPEGRYGNLTADQEAKLKEMWGVLLSYTGTNKENGGLSPADSGYATSGADASNDKHGASQQFQDLVNTQTPEQIRRSCWEFVKHDNPDDSLLRFLRARKWNVDAAIVMLMSAVQWRTQQVMVDSEILRRGEGYAIKQTQADSDASAAQRKQSEEYLAQLRMGKAFLHGEDKEGRPVSYVRVRLHKRSQQSDESLERFIVYVIESSRFLLKPPVDTATIVFDMTGFTLANMDYTPVKLIIKCFEANYPESLGALIIYKAPWVFNAIWRIIRGWLDPVVASKVHFASSVKELEAWMPKDGIIKELGGPEDWTYKYQEPAGEEDGLMKDTATRDALDAERYKVVEAYEQNTLKWVNATGDETEIKQERAKLAKEINESYWRLDPYIRARSLYDRNGMVTAPKLERTGPLPASETPAAAAPAATETAAPAPAASVTDSVTETKTDETAKVADIVVPATIPGTKATAVEA